MSGRGWWLLAASLSGGRAAAARVRLWRSLRDAGAVSLRDGLSLLPAVDGARATMTRIVEQVEAAGGSCWLFEVPQQEPALEARLVASFDRRAEYAEIAAAIDALRGKLTEADEATLRREAREIRRALGGVTAHDFFPGPERDRAVDAFDRVQADVERRFSPAEPSAATGSVVRRDPAAFRGRAWATRKRLWVDRVASAWLIRRYIDPEATFVWLDTPADCPADACGFDFDGATFTHVGELVTFEVLLRSFALDRRPGLAGLARLVHHLDVGGEAVPEAAGFEALLSGLRDSHADDDALLGAAMPALDALDRYYAKAGSPTAALSSTGVVS